MNAMRYSVRWGLFVSDVLTGAYYHSKIKEQKAYHKKY